MQIEKEIFNKVTDKLLKLSFNFSYEEKDLLKKIFEIIGKNFYFSRVSYNAYRTPYHICILEWKRKNIKSSLNYKLHDEIVKYFFYKKVRVFNIKKLSKNIPLKIKKYQNFIKSFFEELDIENLIFIPVKTKDKTFGSLTIDICKRQKIKPEIDQNLKTYLLKITKFIINIIKSYELQNKINETIKKYKEIFENATDPVFINEVRDNKKIGFFIEANKAGLKLLKYSKKDLITKTFSDIISKESLNKFAKIEKEINKKKQFLYEIKIVNKIKKEIYAEINTKVFYLNNKKYTISILRDITLKKETENLLNEFKKHHNILINQIGQITYNYDVKTGKIIWDGAVEKITGYSKNEFNKKVDIKQWEELIHPEDRKKAIDLLLKAEKEIGKYYCIYRFKHKSGKYIYLEDEGTFIPEKEKKAEKMVGVMRDITLRKIQEEMLLESEEKFRTLSEQVNYGILINQDNKIKYANKAILNILEVDENQIYKWTNKDFLNLVYSEDKRIALLNMAEIANYDNYKPYNVQLRILTKSGKIKFIDMNFKKINYKGKRANLITVADITQIKETENRLKLIIKELERANSELEQFAYVTSHDLREPLRMISSYVQLLEKRYKNQLDKDADDFINFIVEGVKRMDQLIKDLLEYSRIGRIEEEKQEIDTNVIIANIIKNLMPLINEKNAKIIFKNLPTIWASEIRITQLFQNLILNAIKFSKKDEPPEIIIEAKKNNNEIIFFIKDNGIGIDKEYHEKIFEIFRKLHSKDEYPGTGIGLAICKKIVNLYNGKIWVESEKGKGSTFYFSLPIKKQKENINDQFNK